MTVTHQEVDLVRDLERPDPRVQLAWLAAGQPQCECPAFCPVQHDNDN